MPKSRNCKSLKYNPIVIFGVPKPWFGIGLQNPTDDDKESMTPVIHESRSFSFCSESSEAIYNTQPMYAGLYYV